MVRFLSTVALLMSVFPWDTLADDWPTLGRDATRNSVSPEKNPPLDWEFTEPRRKPKGDGAVQPATIRRNIRWTAELGSRAFGTPVVAGGLVWIGTTFGDYADGKKPGGSLRCFRESDGKLLYERNSEALELRVHDAGWTGLGGSPLLEGESLWYVTNRWEVVCLDIGPLLKDEKAPRERWTVDLVKEFGVFPRALLMGPPRHCSIAPSYDGRIFVTTGNGIDEASVKLPAPQAPALVCLDKTTGKTLWTDHSPGGNVQYTEAASPLVAEIAGRAQILVPQGDGWLRSFDPATGKVLWQFDLNRKEALLQLGGQGTRNYGLSPPVLYEGRIYVTTGQDVENGEGSGRLVCLDPTKTGDISSELAVDRAGKLLPLRRVQAVVAEDGERAIANPNSGLIWELDAAHQDWERQFHRTISSVAAHDGLVVAVDSAGLVHCVDARIGKFHWSYDLLANCWTTPLIVDGHVFLADEDGDVTILPLSADPKLVKPDSARVINMVKSIYTSPVYANGTLYIATEKLFAIRRERAPRAPQALFVPTPPEVVDTMLALAGVKEKDLVVDLGSGDGRILISAAKTSGAKAVGYEIDRALVALSREKVEQASVEKLVTIHEQDFFTADFSEATVVAAFLYPAVLEKLKPQWARLKPETRIVTHTFEIPGVEADATAELKLPESGDLYRVFLYKTPLRKIKTKP